MIRVRTLLPALILAFGMATTTIAMADSTAANSQRDGHHAATQAAACGQAPRYLEPAYCGPNNGR